MLRQGGCKTGEDWYRKLIGGSSTAAMAAVRGDLGWRKLEERREEKKVLYDKRLQEIDAADQSNSREAQR